MGIGAVSAATACVAGLVLTSCALVALAETPADLNAATVDAQAIGVDVFARPPVEFSGSLETSVMARQLPSDTHREISSQVLAYTHVSTYLWQPWFAVVSADLNAAFEKTLDGHQSEDGFGQITNLSGDFTLSALPSSRYPFQLFYSSSDNRFGGDYSGSDYTRNRAGLSGKAAFTDRTSLDYLVSFDETDRVHYGDLAAQRANATLRHMFDAGEMPLNITDMSISLAYYNTDFKSKQAREPDDSSHSFLGSFYYHAAPLERVDQDFLVSVISDEAKSKALRFDRISEQAVGTLQWRSPSNDFTAIGAVRILNEQNDFFKAQPNTGSALISANAGVSWRPTDRLTLSAGTRANAQRTETLPDESIGAPFDAIESIYGAGVLGSMDYNSLPRKVGGFNWHWDAHADGDFGYDEKYGSLSSASVSAFDQTLDNLTCKTKYGTFYFSCKKYGSASDASVSLGHTLERPMDLPGIGTVNATFFQEAGFARDRGVDEAFEPIITHSTSFSQGFTDQAGSSYVRLYLRDTRNIGDRSEEFQTAQIDFTRRMNLSGDQSVSGNLSAQGVRQAAFEQIDFYVSALANLEYEHRNFFGFEGLSFLSTLRINAIGLNDLTRYWKDDLNPDLFRNDWQNRLQYQVGKLTLSLEGTLFQEDDQLGYYAMFRAGRAFR